VSGSSSGSTSIRPCCNLIRHSTLATSSRSGVRLDDCCQRRDAARSMLTDNDWELSIICRSNAFENSKAFDRHGQTCVADAQIGTACNTGQLGSRLFPLPCPLHQVCRSSICSHHYLRQCHPAIGAGPASYTVTAADMHPVHEKNRIFKFADDT